MTPVESVQTALALLCERAGVNPADGSASAGAKVRAHYSRGWTDTGDAACPHDGPLARWLRRVSNADEFGFFILVTASKVIVTERVCGVIRGYVPLPAAVMSAVSGKTVATRAAA